MKIGICCNWGEDLEDFRAQLKLADELGYDVIGVGDSPAGWRDVYVSMVLAAQDAPKATLATMVTSPFLRHPIVTANAITTLEALAPGRVVLGTATGGSTVMAIGRPPARQTEIEAEFDALQALFKGEGATVNGAPTKALRFPKKIPIYYSAFGPKALALAGARADGVMLFASAENLGMLEQNIADVRAAAKKAGRDPKSVDIWVLSYTAIRETRERAIDDIMSFIAVNAMALRTPELIASIPDAFRDKVLEMHRRYDPTEHVVVGGKNCALVDELGLRDYLSQFYTTAGTPEVAADALRAMKKMGVSTFIAALPGHADPLGVMRSLAEVKKSL